MKKIFGVLVMTAMILSLVGVVSANLECDDGQGLTIIAGKIYNSDYSATVAGATVKVTCDGKLMTKTSESDGAYSVEYCEEDCEQGSELSVYAEKDGLSNTMVGEIHNNYPVPEWNLNLGVVNVPLVPEFTGIIAGLTIMGALGVFFIVRRN